MKRKPVSGPQCQGTWQKSGKYACVYWEHLISANQLTHLISSAKDPIDREGSGKIESSAILNTVFKQLPICDTEYRPSIFKHSTSCRSTVGPFPAVFCLVPRNAWTLLVLSHRAYSSLFLTSLFLLRPSPQIVPKLMVETLTPPLNTLFLLLNTWELRATPSDFVSISPWVLVLLIKERKCYCTSLIRNQTGIKNKQTNKKPCLFTREK